MGEAIPEQPPNPRSPGSAGPDESVGFGDKAHSYLRVIASRETAACVLLGVAAGVLGSKLGLKQLGIAGSAVVGVLLTRILEEQVQRWRTSRVWLLTFLFGLWEWLGKAMEGIQRGAGLAGKGLQLAGWQAGLVSVVAASTVSLGALGASGTIGGVTTSPTATHSDSATLRGIREKGAPSSELFKVSIGDRIDVGVPGPGAGAIEQENSVDDYEFEGERDTHIAVHVIHANNVRSCDFIPRALRYEIFAPSGRELGVLSHSVRPCEAHRWHLPEDGVYVLRVGKNSAATGTYGLRLVGTRVQSFDLNIDSGEVVVAPGSLGEGSGRLASLGEMDVYRFDADAKDRLLLRALAAKGDRTCSARHAQLVAEVFAPGEGGERLDPGWEHPLSYPDGECREYEFHLPAAGIYRVEVSARNDSAVRSAYSLGLALE